LATVAVKLTGISEKRSVYSRIVIVLDCYFTCLDVSCLGQPLGGAPRSRDSALFALHYMAISERIPSGSGLSVHNCISRPEVQ